MKNLDLPGGRRPPSGRPVRPAVGPEVTLLALALLVALGGRAAAIEHRFTEDFKSLQHCDLVNTTARWDTTVGRIGLHPYPLAVVGSYNTPGYAYDVVVDGDYAFVVDRSSGLRVLNITNPSVPTALGVYDTPGLARGVAVSGDLAFVADDDSLLVINIQNTSAPVRRGACRTPGHAWRVAVAGDCVYVADDLYGLQVIDVRNPAYPAVIGSYSTPGNANDVAVWGDHAYLVGSFGLRVVDISDPASPHYEGDLTTGGDAWGVTIAGDRAYLAGQFGLLAVDIGDPAAPQMLGGCPTPGSAMDVTVTGDWAYVTDYDQKLHVVDVTDPAAPDLAATLDLDGFAWGVAVAGERAYVACGNAGMAVVDIAERWPLMDVGFCTVVSGCIEIVGDRAYTTQYNGFTVLDLSDPCSPVVTGSMALDGAWENGLVVEGTHAYVGARWAGLHVVDVSDPESPFLAASRSTPAYPQAVALAGDRLYVAINTKGLEVFDITDPASPDSLANWDSPGYATGVAVAGDCAFLGDGGYGLQILNISDPANPTLRGSYNTPESASRVVLAGDRAFVTDHHSLEVINISNPAAPTSAGSFDQVGYGAGFAIAGDLAIYTSYDYRPGIRVLNISNPAAPSLIESVDHIVGPVVLAGDYAYLLQHDYEDGIRIMQFLQRRHDTDPGDRFVRSLARPTGEDPILRARLTTAQHDSVAWYASTDGGASWMSLEPREQWHRLLPVGTDLIWRSQHYYVGDGAPDCTSLELEWLYQFACIDSVVDVPHDQGGWARLHFTRSGLDFADETSEPILSYLVYRRTDGSKRPPGGALATAAGLPPGTWEHVGTVPAFQSDGYVCLVPTLEDSAATFTPSVYCVAAQTTGPGVYYSYPDSGWSVDNIPPAVPEGLAVAYAPGENALSWEAGPDLDLTGYRIYRGESDDFVPDPATLVHVTGGTDWLDTVTEGWRYRYKVTAFDRVGNESEPASPGTTTGVEAPGVPRTLALLGASPNPFNPSTTVVFELPARLRVRLSIYDAMGRLVRRLVDGEAGPGRREAVWDGRDEAGRGVPSGIYVCRLEAPGSSTARKLTLIR